MAKYSFNLKMKILQEYQPGKVGIKTLAKQHGITSYTSVRKWVAPIRDLEKKDFEVTVNR